MAVEFVLIVLFRLTVAEPDVVVGIRVPNDKFFVAVNVAADAHIGISHKIAKIPRQIINS